jgi:two-component system sensor histidine kinase UhpB
MSLRVRLLSSVIVALLGWMALGSVVTIWQARVSVAREVDAALAVGRQRVADAVDAAAAPVDPTPELRRLIATFNGDRHVQAILVSADNGIAAASTLAPVGEIVPFWFGRAIGVERSVVEIVLNGQPGSFRAIRLVGDPSNEVAEIWHSFVDVILLLLGLCLSGGAFIWWAIGHTLKPLTELTAALGRVGAGGFDARLPAGSLPETRAIVQAFNRMAEDLAESHEDNLALHRQLLSAQEAERGEIARDLHDEIGPLLFAINVDAASAVTAIGRHGQDAALTALAALREELGQLQTRVRAIVNRLRPVGLAEFGLAGAIEGLVQFWQRLHPEILFRLTLPAECRSFGEILDITAYRIIQEALSNAVRHGQPALVAIAVETGSGGDLLVRVTDDGNTAAGFEPGFGLKGMRERVRATGGKLAAEHLSHGGFAVTARLPLAGLAAA